MTELSPQVEKMLISMWDGDAGDSDQRLKLDKWEASQIDKRAKRTLARSSAIVKFSNSIGKLYEKKTELIKDPWLTRRKDISAFQEAIAKANLSAVSATEADQRAEIKRRSGFMKTALGEYNSLIKNAETASEDFADQVFQKALQAGREGSNTPLAVLRSYIHNDPFTGQPKGFRDQPNFTATLRNVFEQANTEAKGLFVFDEETKLITNRDVLYGKAEGGYEGTFNNRLHVNDSNYMNRLRKDIDLYNQKQGEINQKKADLKTAYTDNDLAIKELEGDGAWEAKYAKYAERRQNAQAKMVGWLKTEAAGLPLEHVKALKAEESRVNKQIAEQELELARTKAGATPAAGAGGKAAARSNRVAGFSNQAWLAWARDNGFDNLGHVSGGQYVEGPDDDRAIILFNRQRQSDSGSFRFRAARTGEVVQVELKDGTRVFGERLRRHAADKGGVIRVATEDGLQEFKPRDISRVVVLPSDGKRPQRGFSLDPDIGRRSERIWRRRADEVEEAVGQAMPGDVGEMIGTAVTRGGAYALDDGKYVKQEDFDAAQAEYLASKSLTARDVNGVLYIVDGQDNVYSPSPDGLTLIDPEASNEDALTVGLARGAKPQRLITLMGDEARLMTMDDIVDGKLPVDFEFEETDEDAALYDKLSQDFRKSISPEDLGFTSTTDRPDPFAGQKVTNERNIAGVSFVDLAEDADAPDAELPEDPTAIEQAEADELTEFVRQRQATEVVFGGQEGKEIADRWARVDASLKKLKDPSLTDEGREADLAKLLSGAVGGTPTSGELQERLRQIGLESTKGLSPVTYPESGSIESALAPLSEARLREEASAAAKGVAADQESRKDALRMASAEAKWRDVPRQSQQSKEEEEEDEAGAAYLEDAAKYDAGKVSAGVVPGAGGFPYRYQSALALSARRKAEDARLKAEDLESSPETTTERP